jgi:hypothetical protein
MHTILFTISSIATLLEPPCCLAGRRTWHAPSVHGGTWQYKNLLNSSYWYVLECTAPYGSSSIRVCFLLNLLLQFCQAESAVLETSASNHTNASSSKLQSTAASPAACFVTSLALFGEGRQRQLFFSGGVDAASAAGGNGSAGVAGTASAGKSTALTLASSEGTGTVQP